jgi:uncharacterized RDD family membrane protein YckC
MASNDDDERRAAGLADAAGRAAFLPARAAARAWRGRFEQAADEVLSAPEIARVVDRVSVVGVTALVASLVGGLRPAWLVGVLLASGWMLIVGTYFVLFWSAAGQTPGMHLLSLRVQGPAGHTPSVGRSLVRLVGSCSRSCRCSRASSVLFTATRRGLPDFLAGTVVLYDDSRA